MHKNHVFKAQQLGESEVKAWKSTGSNREEEDHTGTPKGEKNNGYNLPSASRLGT